METKGVVLVRQRDYLLKYVKRIKILKSTTAASVSQFSIALPDIWRLLSTVHNTRSSIFTTVLY